MAAVELNIENMEQGATVDDTVIAPIDIKDALGVKFDLTGWNATSQIRKKYTDAVATVAFTCTIDLALGRIQLSLTAIQSAAIVAGEYVFDVEIAKAGVVRRIVQGKVTVSPEATK